MGQENIVLYIIIFVLEEFLSCQCTEKNRFHAKNYEIVSGIDEVFYVS